MTRSGGAGRAKPPAARAKPPKTKAKTNEGRWLCGNQPVRRVQFFTKSFLGDDAAVLGPLGGEEPALLRHPAGVASMAWRTTRRFSTDAP